MTALSLLFYRNKCRQGASYLLSPTSGHCLFNNIKQISENKKLFSASFFSQGLPIIYSPMLAQKPPLPMVYENARHVSQRLFTQDLPWIQSFTFQATTCYQLRPMHWDPPLLEKVPPPTPTIMRGVPLLHWMKPPPSLPLEYQALIFWLCHKHLKPL